MYSDRKLYAPPQGKFSKDAGSYQGMQSDIENLYTCMYNEISLKTTHEHSNVLSNFL